MKKLFPYFSQNPLDRLDQTRRDTLTVGQLKAAPSSLFLLFDGADIILDEQEKQCFFTKECLEAFQINQEDIVLLGSVKDITYFAVTIKEKLPQHLSKVSLRSFVHCDYIEENKLGIIAQGASVLNWHSLHQFCPKCGGATLVGHAGWRRDCLTCKRTHFPRVDPVVIMLVTYEDFCLLGRGVHFAQDRYSCLAGYVESGETLEDAARRELFEEAGVIGLDATYISSQPWPFPSTLMVGIHLVAQSQKLTLDPKEIADAKWVHKDDVKRMLAGDEGFGMSIPDKIAIARNLLEFWVQA
jgi:NAD+ diphosphatase